MDKIYDIFNYIEEKLNIDFNDMKVKVKNILKQLHLIKHCLKKTIQLG